MPHPGRPSGSPLQSDALAKARALKQAKAEYAKLQ